MVEEILDTLTLVKNFAKVGLQMIRGHSNIKGIDLADRVAKESIKISIRKIKLPGTMVENKAKVNEIIMEKCQSRWNFFGPEIARKFYPTIPKGKVTTVNRMTNKDFGTLYKVVSGHALLENVGKCW